MRSPPRLGVDGAQLVFGAGADEILELLAKVLLGPGDECVFAWPSFAMYPIVVQGMGARSVRVPLDAGPGARPAGAGARRDAAHEARSSSAIRTIRPAPASAPRRSIASWPRCRRRLVLAIDEAYVDFARRPISRTRSPGCGGGRARIVLRTFSKISGLAGVRIGYGVADPELAGYLQRARHPFNVSRLAEAAALGALEDDEFRERTRRNNAEGVEYLSRELRALGVEVWPTDANFLLARAGAGIQARLLREGLIVRPLAGFGMPEHVRISVGLPEENELLVKALRRLLEGGA